ncbi:hypothetical protein HBA91_18190, partial [Ochrobactrum sp. MR34]|nr:hypothetical protein [Ochrobactrum sp. MR34]
TQRKQEICAQNNGYTDGEWYGVIEKVTTNSDGHGVVSLKIAPNIIIKTWNNALSDIGHGTLIKKDTPLYSGASTLKPGDKVKFTGKFFGDD